MNYWSNKLLMFVNISKLCLRFFLLSILPFLMKLFYILRKVTCGTEKSRKGKRSDSQPSNLFKKLFISSSLTLFYFHQSWSDISHLFFNHNFKTLLSICYWLVPRSSQFYILSMARNLYHSPTTLPPEPLHTFQHGPPSDSMESDYGMLRICASI